jgi:hypothetical protein
MAVTADDLELPLAIADTQRHLAGKLGIDPKSVEHELSKVRHGRARSGRNRGYKLLEVDIEEEEYGK